MTFPLMPGYDHINLVPGLDPVAAVKDRELGDSIHRYPKLLPAGSPDFGHAVQTGTEWRIGCTGAADPAGARYDLASNLRRRANGLEGEPGLAADLLAAADRLDPEEGEQLPKDEWEIGDRRYRVIRVEKYTLIGDGVMEPPRPTDASPACGSGSALRGFLLDPRAPAGQWEAQLRLNLVGYMPVLGPVPDVIRAEARHAVQSHPAVVLLPPTFTMVEIKDGSWEPITGADDPVRARDHLAGYFAELLPRLREFQGAPPTAAELADWAEAAEQIGAATGHDFTAIGRRFRTVRVSRMLRLGRDGPEGPRPSDQERYDLPESC
ncbi:MULTISPECIES: DUF5954 family protein [Thermomonosporaceae]|uniref:DUF5954 family protein n=1 Tax=Thermomonosporaceae TaxID=2012 RepID=UPI00255AC022|nr:MULTISPECIES: DUF5954 family protein [Thermomonosporaceae]MDL4773882.1 DUF5954 family protein [Actinomadura xylanilytica]